MIPELVENGVQPPLSREQVKAINDNLNVLSNSCAHLGCPMRWVVKESGDEFLCHGGIYDSYMVERLVKVAGGYFNVSSS